MYFPGRHGRGERQREQLEGDDHHRELEADPEGQHHPHDQGDVARRRVERRHVGTTDLDEDLTTGQYLEVTLTFDNSDGRAGGPW